MLQCGNTTCNYEWLVKWQSSDRSGKGDKSSQYPNNRLVQCYPILAQVQE